MKRCFCYLLTLVLGSLAVGGLVFAQVLEHAGVYKRDKAGRDAFLRFLHTI
jgi:galactose-1-phosphate uridylyltransferase